jgi:hypothetical protein
MMVIMMIMMVMVMVTLYSGKGYLTRATSIVAEI